LPLIEDRAMVTACARSGVAAKVSRLLCSVRGAGNRCVSFSSGRVNHAIDAGRNVRGRAFYSAGQQLWRNAGKTAAFRQSSPLTNQGVYKTP